VALSFDTGVDEGVSPGVGLAGGLGGELGGGSGGVVAGGTLAVACGSSTTMVADARTAALDRAVGSAWTARPPARLSNAVT
jgi:hypothetical protein